MPWRLAAFLIMVMMIVAGPAAAPAEARAPADYKIAVLAPQTPRDTLENFYAGLFHEDMVKIFGGKPLEYLFYPEGGEAEVTQHILKLAEEKNLKAVVLMQPPSGAGEGLMELRARRPDIFAIAVEPLESLELMSKAATLTLSLNHTARGVTFPVLAEKMGARTIVYFSFPRYFTHEQMASQHRIMGRVVKDMGMILVSDFDGPDPAVKANLEPAADYLNEAVDFYLRQYGPDTAFVSPSGFYTDLLGPIIKAKGGCLLPSSRPSLLQGLPEALNLGEPSRALFGKWLQLLVAIDEEVMAEEIPGRLTGWISPYPHTAALAAISLAVSTIEDQTNIFDVEYFSQLLGRHSSATRWQVQTYLNHETDVLSPQVLLVLQDTYWFGRGYMGLTDLNLPSGYFIR